MILFPVAGFVEPFLDVAKKPYQGDFIEFLKRNNLNFRRTADGDGRTEPASFSFLRDNGENGYRANFAFIYRPRTKGVDSRWSSSLEANLANAESDAERNLRFRVGYRYVKPTRNAQSFAPIIEANAKYEADQPFESQQAAFELTFSGTSQNLAMGIGKKVGPVGFFWSPILGIEGGRILERGSISQDDDDLLNLFAKAKAYFILERGDGEKAPFFWLENTFYHRDKADDDRDRNLFAAGFSMPVSEYSSLGITYKNGSASPTFERVNTFEINFGVKF